MIKSKKIFAYLIFFLLSPMLSIKVGVSIKVWFIIVFFYVINLNVRLQLKSKPIYLLIFSLYLVFNLSLLFNIDNPSSFSIFFLFIPIIIFFLVATFDTVDFNTLKNSFNVAINWYMILSILYGLIGYYYYLNNSVENNMVYYGVLIQHLLPRFSGFAEDPNVLAFFLSLIFCIKLALNENKKQLFLILILIFLTGSRTALIVNAVFIALIFNSGKHRLLYFLVFSILSLAFLYTSNADVLSIFRVGDDVDLSRVGGRSDIWFPVIANIVEYPFPNGVGTSREFTYLVKGSYTYFHNTYLEVIYELGFLYLFIYLYLVARIIFKAKISGQSKIAITFTLLVFFMTVNVQYNEFLFFTLYFIYRLSISRKSL